MAAMKRTPLLVGSLIAGLAGIVAPTQADAALLMYEGFSYGASNNVALSTVSGSALGLDGTAYSGGGTNVQYQSAGFTFGSLQVAGGNASLTYNASVFNSNRGLDFSLTSGTLYGSYLLRAADLGTNTGFDAVMFGANANDNQVELAVAGNTAAAGVSMVSGVKTYGTAAISSGATMNINTTYMVLFQVSNLGAAAGDTQQVNMWVLSESQFTNFRLDGLTFAELEAAALGSTATDVWQRLSYTLLVSGTNNISLSNTDQLTLLAYRARYDVDEIRISNFSLNEVTPIPEPTAVILLAGGLTILSLRRRR